jgi:ABC-type phosphate/phosphonate transport system substrate-binding protein
VYLGRWYLVNEHLRKALATFVVAMCKGPQEAAITAGIDVCRALGENGQLEELKAMIAPKEEPEEPEEDPDPVTDPVDTGDEG